MYFWSKFFSNSSINGTFTSSLQGTKQFPNIFFGFGRKFSHKLSPTESLQFILSNLCCSTHVKLPTPEFYCFPPLFFCMDLAFKCPVWHYFAIFKGEICFFCLMILLFCLPICCAFLLPFCFIAVSPYQAFIPHPSLTIHRTLFPYPSRNVGFCLPQACIFTWYGQSCY